MTTKDTARAVCIICRKEFTIPSWDHRFFLLKHKGRLKACICGDCGHLVQEESIIVTGINPDEIDPADKALKVGETAVSATLSVIECSGTPHEIGRQWGEACREHLRQSFEVNIGAIASGYGATIAEAVANAGKYLPHVTEFDPDYLEFVKGQAEGAGMSFEKAFTLRCTLELALHYNQVMGLCSSFAARGEATAARMST